MIGVVGFESGARGQIGVNLKGFAAPERRLWVNKSSLKWSLISDVKASFQHFDAT